MKITCSKCGVPFDETSVRTACLVLHEPGVQCFTCPNCGAYNTYRGLLQRKEFELQVEKEREKRKNEREVKND